MPIQMTYRIRLSFDAAHFLRNYAGPCQNMHGHTWHVEFFIGVPDERDPAGIGIDFKRMKQDLEELLPDHELINNKVHTPTAENIVVYLYDKADEMMALHHRVSCKKVVLWETEKNGIELEYVNAG